MVNRVFEQSWESNTDMDFSEISNILYNRLTGARLYKMNSSVGTSGLVVE